jgi:hypothetical protein
LRRERIALAGTRKSKAADVVFEGVVIPRGTRSAKLAKKGITNEEEMGNFLTAVFADTLKGKIILPKPNSAVGVPSRMLSGSEQKLRRGLPIGIQATGKRRRRSKMQES